MLHSEVGDMPDDGYEAAYAAAEEAAHAAFEQLDITWTSGVSWDQVEGWEEHPDGTFGYFGSFGESLKRESERPDEHR